MVKATEHGPWKGFKMRKGHTGRCGGLAGVGMERKACEGSPGDGHMRFSGHCLPRVSQNQELALPEVSGLLTWFF